MAIKKFCTRTGCKNICNAGERYCTMHKQSSAEKNKEYDLKKEFNKLAKELLDIEIMTNLDTKRNVAKRDKHLEKLKHELAKLNELDGKAHTKAHCRLNSHMVYKKYLKMDSKGNLKINTQAVKEMERLDGKYLIRTSDDTLSVEDVALGFKQLYKVKYAFRTLKTTLELRPVYQHREYRNHVGIHSRSSPSTYGKHCRANRLCRHFSIELERSMFCGGSFFPLFGCTSCTSP